MKSLLPIAALTTALLAAFVSQAASQDDSIGWLTDINEAKRVAKLENKLVLLHFWGTFCRPCVNLDKFVFTNPRVGVAINEHYVPVKIDVQEQPKIANQFGITTIPHDVVITPDGQVIAKQASSPNSDGYLHMVQSVARKASHLTPQAIASAEQIARSTPPNNAPIVNAFVPAGQTSVTPEPIRMIGDSAPMEDAPVRTVGGQTLASQASDERNFTSPQAAESFLSELQLDPSSAANSQQTQQPAAPPLASNSLEATMDNQSNPRVSAQTPGLELRNNSFLPRVSQEPLALPVDQPAAPPAAERIINPTVPASSVSDHARQQLGTAPTSEMTSASTPPRATATPADQPENLGMDGFCPVTFCATGKLVAGDRRWGCEHRGRLYYFASPQLRDQFQLTPDVLSPMLAGFDPVAFVENGELVAGKLEHRIEVESTRGKSVFLFSSAIHQSQFDGNRQKYIDEILAAIRLADAEPITR